MNQGKVPKRIHKAEREKMKREHLNELFLDLANALGKLLCLYCLFWLCSNFTMVVYACLFNLSVMFLFLLGIPYDIWYVTRIWLYVPFLVVMGIDLNDPNSGKASILCEASKLLKDLLCQIHSLKKENVSLLSESQYVRFALFYFLWSINLRCWEYCMLNFDVHGGKLLLFASCFEIHSVCVIVWPFTWAYYHFVTL